MQGSEASQSQVPAYDGYTALAGFAFTLSLVTNFVETGKVRHRGDFPSRSLVKARPIVAGSVAGDFIAILQSPAIVAIGEGVVGSMIAAVLYDVVKRTLNRNVGDAITHQTQQAEQIERERGGDLEALVAAVEPSVRQTHAIIGNGAQQVNIYGGNVVINRFDADTKEYVNSSVEDRSLLEKDVSVASFNANSGYGGVFDEDIGRVIPVKITKETLARAKSVLSWGLNEYANGTGRRVTLRYFRLLALDGTPKRYVVVDASIPSV